MRTKVVLITGGYTGEAAVSYKSAAFVKANIDTEKFTVYTVDITPEGWRCEAPNGVEYELDLRDFSIQVDQQKIQFDVALIILHGSPGEDGKLQGYLDMVHVPYTTCDALTSALTMNKGYTKAILRDIDNLHLAESVLLFGDQRGGAIERIRQKLQLPLFVKPNAGGSSIGMSKVSGWEDLDAALEKAFDAENTGNQVLVEEFVQGREFSQGIYRDAQGHIRVLPASEIKTTREFFDFEAKYTPGLTQEITPAELTAAQKQNADQMITQIYQTLNCKGMVRVDFFLQQETDHFYFIEINTVPGQTEQSFIPQQVRAAGMTETTFYTDLLQAALKK